jgi:hypothetical protein
MNKPPWIASSEADEFAQWVELWFVSHYRRDVRKNVMKADLR